MPTQSKQFSLSHQCEITDVNCWKNQLKTKFNCRSNDLDCWKNATDRLPCNIADVDCWKKRLPDLPCEHNDKQCWKNMLPGNLPCDLGDRQCWENVRQKGQQIAYPTTLTQNDLTSFEDKVQNQFDRYYAYGFGII